MKNETKEYLEGLRNATRDEFILSRESVGNAERVYLSLPNTAQDEQLVIYELWTKKMIPVAKPNAAEENIVEVEVTKARPKHTGGKRPYIMIMQDKDIKSLSLDARGFLLSIYAGGLIEWSTGRIIDRIKKTSLTAKEIANKTSIGQSKVKTIISELEKEKIITYNRSERAYYISRDYAKKGGPVK